MRTQNLFSRLGAMLFALVLLLVVATETSLASGTAAGTKISSTAIVAYNNQAGGIMPPDTASVSIYVAQKPSSSITIAEANQSQYDGGYVVYSITVNNTSNGTDRYAIEDTVAYGASRIASVSVYSDAGLTTLLGGSAKNIGPAINADGNATVYAKVAIVSDGNNLTMDRDSIGLKFYARSTSNEVDSTHLNVDGGIIAIPHAFLNALSSSVLRNTAIKEAQITLTTTAGQAGYRPGSIVGYQLTYSNSGSGRASNFVIDVHLPTGMTFASGTGWSDIGGGVAQYNAIANLVSGQSTNFDSLYVTLNDDPTTNIESNVRAFTFSVTYDDSNTVTGISGRTRLLAANPASITVLFKSYAPTISVALQSDTADVRVPGDSLLFKYTITNNSNGSDNYRIKYITASNTTPTGPSDWVFRYYQDNGNGTYLASEETRLDTNTTLLVARTSSVTVWFRALVPNVSFIDSVVYLDNKFSSYRDSVIYKANTTLYDLRGDVTAELPRLTVVRTRVINGDSTSTGAGFGVVPGGSVVFYTYVQNLGSSSAFSVQISDQGTNLSNVTRDDNVYIYDGTSETDVNGIISHLGVQQTNGGYQVTATAGAYTINLGTIPPNGVRRIRYQVTVN